MATPSEKSSPDLVGAPAELWDIRAEKNLAYARARKLYEAIRINDSRTYRLEAALKLLDEMDAVNDAWGVIDEWKETGGVRDTRKKKAKVDIASLSMPELIRQERSEEHTSELQSLIRHSYAVFCLNKQKEIKH